MRRVFPTHVLVQYGTLKSGVSGTEHARSGHQRIPARAENGCLHNSAAEPLELQLRAWGYSCCRFFQGFCLEGMLPPLVGDKNYGQVVQTTVTFQPILCGPLPPD